MDVELRHLRSLASVIDTGTFTDAGIELGISQTAVSRNVAALESALGVRLLHRTTRSVELTPAGERVLRHARRALAVVAALRQEALAGVSTIRIGYAWSALGKHTPEFQRRWAAALPHHELRLIRTNTPTAGLQEGTSDLVILRRIPEATNLELALIGAEKRYCAMSVDDPLATKRTVTLTQVTESSLAIDHRTGSTQLDLWPDDSRPHHTIPTNDVETGSPSSAVAKRAESPQNQQHTNTAAKASPTGPSATPHPYPSTPPGGKPTHPRSCTTSSPSSQTSTTPAETLCAGGSS